MPANKYRQTEHKHSIVSNEVTGNDLQLLWQKREPGEAFIKCHLREYITIKYSPQGGRKEEKKPESDQASQSLIYKKSGIWYCVLWKILQAV